MVKLSLALLASMLVLAPAPSFAEAAPALNPNLPRQTAMMKPRFARAYPKHIKRREFNNGTTPTAEVTTTKDSSKESPSPDGAGGIGIDLSAPLVGSISVGIPNPLAPSDGGGESTPKEGSSITSKISSRQAQSDSNSPSESSKAVSTPAGGVIPDVVGGVSTLVGGVSAAVSDLGNGPGGVSAAVSDLGNGAGGALSDIDSGVGGILTSPESSRLNTDASSTPTTQATNPSEDTSSRTPASDTTSDPPPLVPVGPILSSVLPPVVSVISTAVAPIVSDVSTAVAPIVTPIVSELSTAVAPLTSELGTISSELSTGLAPVVSDLSTAVAPLTSGLAPVVSDASTGVAPIVSEISTFVDPPPATDTPSGPITSAPEPSNTPAPVTTDSGNLVGTIISGVGSVISGVGSEVSSIISGVGSIVSGGASEVGSIITGVETGAPTITPPFTFTIPPDNTPTDIQTPPAQGPSTSPGNPLDGLTTLLPTLFPPTASDSPTGPAIPTNTGTGVPPTSAPNTQPVPTDTGIASNPINTNSGSPTGATASSPSASPAPASTGTDAQTAPINSGSASVQPTASAEPATSQAQQTAASATLSQAPATTAEASVSRPPAPTSLIATGSDTQTQMYLPTSLILDTTTPSSPNPTASTAAASTNGIPSAIPRVIPPPGSGGVLPKQPEDTTLIQIGFQYQLNYPFVLDNPPAIYQIFDILPNGIAYGLSIKPENVTMQSLQPYDTTRLYGYITTVALAYIPTGNVGNLSQQVPNPAAQLYKNPNSTRAALMSVIDPSFPVIAGQGMNGGDGTAPGGPTQTNTVVDQNPLDANNSNGGGVNGTSVGIGVGVVAGAAVYGAAMFFVAKRYKKRKARHSRSSSMLDTSSMVQNGNEQATGATAALMGHSQDGSGGSYGTAQRNLSRNSGGSGSSRGRDISAPVMAENSLGWN